MDDPILQEQLTLFTPEYQAMVTGPVPEVAASTFGDAYQLSEHDKTVLENGIRLYLLALLSKEEWIEFTSEYTTLDTDTAKLFVTEISSYFSPQVEQALKQVRGEADPTTNDREPVSDKNTLAKEIAETEAALEKIPAVRTMESDKTQHNQATTEAVHTAAGQDELLTRDQEAPTAPQQPSAESAPPPEPAPSNTATEAAQTPISANNETDDVPLQGTPSQGPRWESEHKDT